MQPVVEYLHIDEVAYAWSLASSTGVLSWSFILSGIVLGMFAELCSGVATGLQKSAETLNNNILKTNETLGDLKNQVRWNSEDTHKQLGNIVTELQVVAKELELKRSV